MATSVELLESQQASWAPPAAKPLDEAVWQTWLSKGRARDQRNRAARIKVIKWAGIVGLLAAAGLGFRLAAATSVTDLSKYRNFELGTDLSTVAAQTGANVSQAKVIHRRPALIQELEWSPRTLGASSKPEAAQEVVFSFYDGKLFRIAVNYDRYETEGLTAEDFVDAISAAYGPGTKPEAPVKVAPASYGDQEEILAQWQDSQYRFDLMRSSYGPSFRLIGVVKGLEVQAQASTLEAKRLDDLEAPQRDAARLASEAEAERGKLEKARLVNKPKFRP
jgi:hypothetical protein